MADNYANAEFDLSVWAAREKLGPDTVAALYREKITSPESISRLEEGDIKDLGLPIGERALLRAAAKNLTAMSRRPCIAPAGKPPTPVRRVAPRAPPSGAAAHGPSGGSRLHPGGIGSDDEHYETIPFDRTTGLEGVEPYYANVDSTEGDYMVATGSAKKGKRRAPPPPPSPGNPCPAAPFHGGTRPGSRGTPGGDIPRSPRLRVKPRPAPAPPGSTAGRPPSGSTSHRTSSYVTLSQVAQSHEDKCSCLDEPTFAKEIQYVYLTRTDVNNLLNSYDCLSPKFDIYDKPHGSPELRLSLAGTIPYSYKATQYYIPLKIWLDRGHPYQSPVVYVIPTPDMTLNPNAFVDQSGFVTVGYLKKWKHPNSDLLGLIDALTKAFTQQSPVYAKLPLRK